MTTNELKEKYTELRKRCLELQKKRVQKKSRLEYIIWQKRKPTCGKSSSRPGFQGGRREF